MSGSPPRWRRRPEGSTWGDWGPDDQLGRINLLTDAVRRAALLEAREGRAFCLSLPLDYPGGTALSPRRHPPELRPTWRDDLPSTNYPFAREAPCCTDIISDDAVLLHLQYSTQWDSLAHIGALFDADDDGVAEPVYYNGFRAGIDVTGPMDYRGDTPEPTGHAGSYAKALGIDTLALSCVQGRGVMIDLGRHFGPDRTLVGYHGLMQALDADRVTVEPGDLVCLRTGFDDVVLGMGKAPDAQRLHHACAVLDGRDARLLRWITDTGLAALISDNAAVEQVVPGNGPDVTSRLPLHGHCLFKLGVPLGELWRLTPLAGWLREHGRNRFLLTAPPLRLPGAVGSPVTPVATV